MSCTKNRVLSLLMLLAMMVSLVGCGGGSGSDVAGTYLMSEMNANGVTVDIKELSSQSGVEVKIELILEESGNFTLDMGALGVSQSLAGTWEADGDTLTLTSDGQDVPATVDGTTITLEQDGNTLVFNKK